MNPKNGIRYDSWCAQNAWLVQTEDFVQINELFNAEYSYFSGFSKTWLTHAECYVNKIIQRFKLNQNSHIIEVAANDGIFITNLLKKTISPAQGLNLLACTAKAARNKGINIIEDFFGLELAHKMVSQNKQADLIIANNVLAHVPDINDFVSGFTCVLKPQGIATFEFPHLMKLVNCKQFDTIYHEHFSYFSFTTVHRIFKANGLSIFDVEELETHGGSLRGFCPAVKNWNASR